MSKLDPRAHAPYAHPEEYILEWTERIWREGGMGLIREMYATDLEVHGAYGTSVGVETVIRGSIAKHSVFPNRAGTAEDVLWEARGGSGFVSYHRALHVGPHEGPWVYGPASYRTSVSRGIAVCLVQDSKVVEEWIVRDEWAVVDQLGFEPEEVARRMAISAGPAVPGAGEDTRTLGAAPQHPEISGASGRRPNTHPEAVQLVADLIGQVWNDRHFHLVPDLCHRDVLCHSAGRRVGARAVGYQRELWRLLGAIPDGEFEIHDLAAQHGADTGVRVAALWRFTGTYTGAPVYGPPTGSSVDVLGVSMFEFRDSVIVREYRVYDELALLVQVTRARMAAEEARA
jgi:predicted ester cyclase